MRRPRMGRDEHGLRGCLHHNLKKLLCVQPKYGSSFRVNNPLPVGSSFSPSSLNHLGCVKSPVPITVMPFNCAHFQIFSGDISGLVALEYLEWMWRSAMK